MQVIEVPLTHQPYQVRIGAGVRHELAQVLAERCPAAQQVWIITQQPVVDAGWLEGIDTGLETHRFVVGEGEEAKSLETLGAIASAMAQANCSRRDVVVGFGGGIATDLAGFLAASYHRGISLITVPTTLLAQVDAAVGGKTGVNLAEGKNLLGAFWQPEAVLCDTETLASLPPREWACGRGEVAKYALLEGAAGASLLELDLEDQVARCVAHKATVVAADEREQAARALLNYGHTLAHALEAVDLAGGNLDLRHGEAVAIGLLFAAQLAQRLGRIDATRVNEHRAVLARLDLDGTLPSGLSAAELVGHMAKDKKAAHDLTFVLDGDRGCAVVPGIDPALVTATLEALGARP